MEIDVDEIVTEDDTPVDNLLSEKQQRLLNQVFIGPRPHRVG
jgi:hypothetical protein